MSTELYQWRENGARHHRFRILEMFNAPRNQPGLQQRERPWGAVSISDGSRPRHSATRRLSPQGTMFGHQRRWAYPKTYIFSHSWRKHRQHCSGYDYLLIWSLLTNPIIRSFGLAFAYLRIGFIIYEWNNKTTRLDLFLPVSSLLWFRFIRFIFPTRTLVTPTRTQLYCFIKGFLQ